MGSERTAAEEPFAEFSQLSPRQLDISEVELRLNKWLRELRKSSGHRRYFAIFHAKELTRQLDLVADCGLQKDIKKRIGEGRLSFTKAWAKAAQDDCWTAYIDLVAPTSDPLTNHFRVLFGPHPIRSIGLTTVWCDQHDAIVFLEAHYDDGDIFDLVRQDESLLVNLARVVYFSILKFLRKQNVSDWEKAVHELASPLDFIYSNSDFLHYYLGLADIDDEYKKKKLDDFKLISELLVNRLHQLRFAHAGSLDITLNPEWTDLFSLCMPITHLWYHDAQNKSLRFHYDGLKNKPKIYTDKSLLQFILFNLVSNAVKYSDRRTEVRIYAEEKVGGRLAMGVGNVGLVIADEEVDKIFRHGYRALGARKKDARGMGIGLTVCWQLAERLDGSVRLIKSSKEGTVFEVQLPRELERVS